MALVVHWMVEAPRLARPPLTRLARAIFRELGLDWRRGSALVLCGDAAMGDFNGRFRGKPTPTDVLSFPHHPVIFEPYPSLGDVIINLDRIVPQAREAGLTPQRELIKLWVHGILHLLGHDHHKRAETRLMESLEHSIQSQLFNLHLDRFDFPVGIPQGEPAIG